jgi:hypothetical protein
MFLTLSLWKHVVFTNLRRWQFYISNYATEQLVVVVSSVLVFGDCTVQISPGTPSILNVGFRGFLKSPTTTGQAVLYICTYVYIHTVQSTQQSKRLHIQLLVFLTLTARGSADNKACGSLSKMLGIPALGKCRDSTLTRPRSFPLDHSAVILSSMLYGARS